MLKTTQHEWAGLVSVTPIPSHAHTSQFAIICAGRLLSSLVRVRSHHVTNFLGKSRWYKNDYAAKLAPHVEVHVC